MLPKSGSASEENLVPKLTLSMRLPRWAHKRIKKDAGDLGRTAADLYGEIIEGFLDRDADRFRKYLLTGPTSSPSVTLALAKPIVTRVRALADERDMAISDIVYTAVLLHLREFEGPAIAA